jgi:hypothetical protein
VIVLELIVITNCKCQIWLPIQTPSVVTLTHDNIKIINIVLRCLVYSDIKFLELSDTKTANY